jgi:hypothetical protein
LMRDKPLGVIEKDCLCKILEFASCCSLNWFVLDFPVSRSEKDSWALKTVVTSSRRMRVEKKMNERMKGFLLSFPSSRRQTIFIQSWIELNCLVE